VQTHAEGVWRVHISMFEFVSEAQQGLGLWVEMKRCVV